MTATFASGSLTAHRPIIRQLASFGAIGVASTLAYVALYAWLRESVPAGVANAVALVITAVANTAANRWLTFGIRSNDGLARHHAAGLLALGAALLITSASLLALNWADPRHGRVAEVAILVAANAVATLVRFLFLRSAVSGALPDDPTPAGAGPAIDGRDPAPLTFANLSQSKGIRG
jgi:putative flippase GtrA